MHGTGNKIILHKSSFFRTGRPRKETLDFTHHPASTSIVRSELHEPNYNVKAVMNKNNIDIYSSVTDLDYQLP